MASLYCYFTRILQGLAFFLVKARAFVTKNLTGITKFKLLQKKERKFWSE